MVKPSKDHHMRQINVAHSATTGMDVNVVKEVKVVVVDRMEISQVPVIKLMVLINNNSNSSNNNNCNKIPINNIRSHHRDVSLVHVVEAVQEVVMALVAAAAVVITAVAHQEVHHVVVINPMDALKTAMKLAMKVRDNNVAADHQDVSSATNVASVEVHQIVEDHHKDVDHDEIIKMVTWMAEINVKVAAIKVAHHVVQVVDQDVVSVEDVAAVWDVHVAKCPAVAINTTTNNSKIR